MIEHGVAVPWQAQVRTDVARDAELLDLMRRSGCRTLALGLESVNQATLDAFEKSQTVADVATAVDALHDVRHRRPRHVRHGRRQRHGRDRARDRGLRARPPASTRVMLNVLTPAPGTRAVRAHGRRRPHLRQELAALRRPARGVHAPPDDARSSCSARCCVPTAASSPRVAGSPAPSAAHSTAWPVDSWCWWYARCWHTDARNRAHLRKLDRLSRAARPAVAVPQRKIA